MFTQSLLTLALVVAAPTLKEKESATVKIPVGEWEIIELTKGGENLLALVGKMTMRIDEKSITMTVAGTEQVVAVEWDVKKMPATIVETKMNMKGIFKVEKDNLILCLSDQPGGDAPQEFAANKGSNCSLMVLKKAEKKESKKKD